MNQVRYDDGFTTLKNLFKAIKETVVEDAKARMSTTEPWTLQKMVPKGHLDVARTPNDAGITRTAIKTSVTARERM